MWRAIGDAVQGRSHLKTNTPCQDKTYIKKIPTGVIAALADGAGSAKLSHYGAEQVTRTICDYLDENYEVLFNEDNGVKVKRTLLETVLLNLDLICEENKCSRYDLASTLQVIAIKNDSYILIHLGDGAIGYLKGNNLKVASVPNNGEFINETIFTTSSNAIKALQIKKGMINEIAGFVLMSDGPEVSLYNKQEKNLVNNIKKVMLNCSLLTDEKAQLIIRETLENTLKNKTMDDCSLIIVVDDEKVIHYLLQDNEYKGKVCGIKSDDPKYIAKKLKMFSELLDYTKEPKQLDQIAEHLNVRNKTAKKRMASLEAYRIIENRDGYYHSNLTF